MKKIRMELLGVLALALVLALHVIWEKRIQKEIIKDGNFTIGYITNESSSRRGRKTIVYKFNVKSIWYYNNMFRGGPSSGTYLVAFIPNDPSRSHLMSYYPVDTALFKPPPEGWKEIPEALKK